MHKFTFPTEINFGVDARKLVAPWLLNRDLKRPLIVSDKILADLPVFKEFLSHLNNLEYLVYAGVYGNPTASQVMHAAEIYSKHNADCIIGIGGGASIDVAKVVGLAATHHGDILDYAWDHPQVKLITDKLPCFVALPTTSGTGSEVGRSSVISEDESHIKRFIADPKLLAKCVFADPVLTLGLPPFITATTGIDALTHNIESYLSTEYHPICDGIALEGLRLAASSLTMAVHDSNNIKARSNMMLAALMGAIAFQKDLGAVHSCAHALSAVCDMHHGLANGLMLDIVLDWNYEVCKEKFSEMAHVCKITGGASLFTTWLRDLKKNIGISGSLSKHGVKEYQLEKLSQVAYSDICHKTNPRACSSADFQYFFRNAF